MAQRSCYDCGKLCGALTRCNACETSYGYVNDAAKRAILDKTKGRCPKCGGSLTIFTNGRTRAKFVGCPNWKYCGKPSAPDIHRL